MRWEKGKRDVLAFTTSPSTSWQTADEVGVVATLREIKI